MKNRLTWVAGAAAAFAAFFMVACGPDTPKTQSAPMIDSPPSRTELATFGGGCFWCVEAVFEKLKGVKTVTSGYSGGHVVNPTYEQICQKDTGHAEVVQVAFDPAIISFEQLLDVFWIAHDPTTLNQQGADRGPQYRSVIFYHSPEQLAYAERSKAIANSPDQYNGRIVTEISALQKFYPAEGYHQDYYQKNPSQPYCQVVIAPKLRKLNSLFK